ncbi:LysE family translocator [Escherichia coli]|uniref:LysE family translocator n=1 Tax=Escherichia coli TaxID=562 RepID=A0A376KZL3_ECOLX|nr:LysE family translocator [Escherichia coli]
MMKLLHLFMDEITMDPLHAVYLTVGLFVITFFNPGANLFVVVQTSLASGRRAGVLTGLGVALGDAFYSGLGLFGLATLITQCEEIFFAYQNRRAALISYGLRGAACAASQHRK